MEQHLWEGREEGERREERGGKARDRIRQREELTCDTVTTETSREPAGRFEAKKSIQSCLRLGQGDWVFRLLCWLVCGCRQPPPS